MLTKSSIVQPTENLMSTSSCTSSMGTKVKRQVKYFPAYLSPRLFRNSIHKENVYYINQVRPLFTR